jgi:Tol biopolymer transport system component
VLQVFTRALGSSDSAQITRGDKAVHFPRWSSDGSTIYYNSDSSIWAIGATGGIPERLFEHADAFSVHPDGKTFFSFGQNEFQIGSRGGKVQDFSLPKELSDLRGNRAMIGFSPDGSKQALIGAGALWVLPYPSPGASGSAIRGG